MAELQQAILKITELLQKMAAPAAAPDNSEQILESLATNISEFSFDEENGVTFDKWFRRYEDMFKEDASKLKEEAKSGEQPILVLTAEQFQLQRIQHGHLADNPFGTGSFGFLLRGGRRWGYSSFQFDTDRSTHAVVATSSC
ncbi:conserved hypothetical protein [Culex quinquefasciatus]|uniref:DUF7083 domain-containing protein n=1 Tax=Culex quinquefasciatus TaxID=7176 RepID=B0WTM3_CULQU|nr:conserved hypothetical protein [Culex quinquefasciatus]|eukprot:XP_001854888.1 conserved hypothetical protein [Culex quinquefasciatus]